MSVPSDIASYPTEEEKILKTGHAEGKQVFLTNKRIIFKTKDFLGGKEIVEASYRHISSIEYEKKISLGYVVAGIIVIVVGLLIYFFPLLDTGIWDLYASLIYYLLLTTGAGPDDPAPVVQQFC